MQGHGGKVVKPLSKHPTCSWIIATRPSTVFCPHSPTHYEPDGAGQFCECHAEDYEDVFGDVLHEFPIEEVSMSSNQQALAAAKERIKSLEDANKSNRLVMSALRTANEELQSHIKRLEEAFSYAVNGASAAFDAAGIPPGEFVDRANAVTTRIKRLLELGDAMAFGEGEFVKYAHAWHWTLCWGYARACCSALV